MVVADTCAVMCTDGIEAGIMSGSRAYIVHVHGIHHAYCFAGQCHLALVMIFLVLADVLVAFLVLADFLVQQVVATLQGCDRNIPVL